MTFVRVKLAFKSSGLHAKRLLGQAVDLQIRTNCLEMASQVRLDQPDEWAEHGHAWGHNNKSYPQQCRDIYLQNLRCSMAFLGVVLVRPFHGGLREGRPVPEAH